MKILKKNSIQYLIYNKKINKLIIDKNIKIKINSINFKRLKKLKYKFNKVGNIINIKISDLSKGSHKRINVKCSYCNTIKQVDYCNYITQTKNSDYCCNKCKLIKTNNTIKTKYNVDNISKLDIIKKKKEETTFKNYGVKHTFQSNINIKKRKKTLLKKYNVEHNSQIESVKKAKQLFSDDELPKWKKYQRSVRQQTKSKKKILLEFWDGTDYYDGEYIKNYFYLNCYNKKYPNIDHKLSIFYGFKNNISIEEMISIENLCFTKRSHNMRKNTKTNIEYKKIINKK